MEVRGQPLEVGPLLPPCGTQDRPQVARPGGKLLSQPALSRALPPVLFCGVVVFNRFGVAFFFF